jgi:hypothetical protein
MKLPICINQYAMLGSCNINFIYECTGHEAGRVIKNKKVPVFPMDWPIRWQ